VRRLIVNADDFGMTPGINRAIVEGCERGIITSTTLMATSLAFDDAVARAHELRVRKPRFSIGCHIALLDGVPLLPPGRVSTLLQRPLGGGSAQLRANLSDFARSALRGKLASDEIEAEADAQFGRILSAGITLSHFDCHKHAHMFPAVLQPLLRAAKARRVRAVRNPFGQLFPLPFDRILRSPKLWTRLAEMSVLRNFAARFRSEVQKHGLNTPDGSVGVLVTGTLDRRHFTSIIENLPEGTWEFVCHPGYNDAELRAAGTRLLDSRDEERRLLTSAELRQFLEEQKIQVIGYREFVETFAEKRS